MQWNCLEHCPVWSNLNRRIKWAWQESHFYNVNTFSITNNNYKILYNVRDFRSNALNKNLIPFFSAVFMRLFNYSESFSLLPLIRPSLNNVCLSWFPLAVIQSFFLNVMFNYMTPLELVLRLFLIAQEQLVWYIWFLWSYATSIAGTPSNDPHYSILLTIATIGRYSFTEFNHGLFIVGVTALKAV